MIYHKVRIASCGIGHHVEPTPHQLRRASHPQRTGVSEAPLKRTRPRVNMQDGPRSLGFSVRQQGSGTSSVLPTYNTTIIRFPLTLQSQCRLLASGYELRWIVMLDKLLEIERSSRIIHMITLSSPYIRQAFVRRALTFPVALLLLDQSLLAPYFRDIRYVVPRLWDKGRGKTGSISHIDACD